MSHRVPQLVRFTSLLRLCTPSLYNSELGSTARSKPALVSLCKRNNTSIRAPSVSEMTYAVGVRDSLMIAHSFKGEEFGPAQQVRLEGLLVASADVHDVVELPDEQYRH